MKAVYIRRFPKMGFARDEQAKRVKASDDKAVGRSKTTGQNG